MKWEEAHSPYLPLMVAGTDVYKKEPKNLAGSVWPGSDHLSQGSSSPTQNSSKSGNPTVKLGLSICLIGKILKKQYCQRGALLEWFADD